MGAMENWDKQMEMLLDRQEIDQQVEERISLMDMLDLWSAEQIKALANWNGSPEDKYRYAFIMLGASSMGKNYKEIDFMESVAFDELYRVPVEALMKEVAVYLQYGAGIIKEIGKGRRK